MRSSKKLWEGSACNDSLTTMTTHKSFWSLLGCILRLRTHFRDASRSLFTWHGGCQRCFQFSPHIFEGFFVILVFCINEVNSSHSSNIVEFWLLVLPFLFFHDSERLYKSWSILLDIHLIFTIADGRIKTPLEEIRN